MGLDNGLILRCRHKINEEDIPSYVKLEQWKEELEYEYNPDTGEKKPRGTVDYDFAYWRKCWNIRAIILSYCRADLNNPEQWQYDITPETLLKIQNDLVEILKDPAKWDEDHSIWTFEEQKQALVQQIINITWVAKYVKEHQGCFIEFYDSY